MEELKEELKKAFFTVHRRLVHEFMVEVKKYPNMIVKDILKLPNVKRINDAIDLLEELYPNLK